MLLLQSLRLPCSGSLVMLPLTVVAAGLVAGCAGQVATSPTTSGSPPGMFAPVAAGPAASDVLRSWDLARSEAFAEGDPAALRRLYVPGSPAGTADERLLRAYLRRGLRVQGMRMQVLAVEVLREDRRRLRLRVTDRLVGAEAVGHRWALPLPRDNASTRVVELARSAGGHPWRVAWVRESSPR